MRFAFLALLLGYSATASSADFDYPAYTPSKLADVADSLEIGPTTNYWFDAAHPRYSTSATFTGRTRAIDPGVRKFIAMWVKTMGHPPAYATAFRTEVQIRQGSRTFWMPIQSVLTVPFEREVPRDTGVTLYVLLIGALDRVPIFGINEFNAESI